MSDHCKNVEAERFKGEVSGSMDSEEQIYSITEAIEAAQEALRHAYLDTGSRAEVEEVYRVARHALARFDSYAPDYSPNSWPYPAIWGAALHFGLRATFDFQTLGIQTWLSLIDAALQLSRAQFDLTAGSIRIGQDLISELLALGYGLAEPDPFGTRS